jgi:hypothetical protein
MYRPSNPQSSFFEPGILCPGFLPKDDWSDIYREKIWHLLDEDKFKHLYEKEGGAPILSIRLKLSMLIFMSMETLTWRAAEYMFPRRLDWLHATCSSIGDKGIDHTTLFDFYQRLQTDDSTKQLFSDLTTTFIEECGISLKKQRTDSFFMHGWLAILSRYGLFKETIRLFLQVLRKHQTDLYEGIKEDLSCDYLKDAFDLTEKDKHKAQTRIHSMAEDIYQLKTAFENHDSIKSYQTFQTLVTVFEQQCEIMKEIVISDRTSIDDSNSLDDSNKHSEEEISDNSENHQATLSIPEIKIREKPIGEQIISSPHNTDAVYTRKRNQKVVGHKAFVTETCDSKNPIQMITDINLEVATHSDSKEISKIEERLINNESKPEKLYSDAGFVNGSSILDSDGEGIKLEGPSSGRSQSIENFEKEDRPLDIADFEIDTEAGMEQPVVHACPKGNIPISQRISSKTDKFLYSFDREICIECELNSRCPIKIGKRTATLTFDDKNYAGAIRHHLYMSNADYRKECAIRSGAESLVNEIANSHGARKSRHKTEKRSRLQLTFSALSCNIKRYMKHMGKYVQNPIISMETA